MPTIDQLDAVIVASDDDSLPVSQSGIVRRVSRSQLLAGTQAALALTPGLLGRTSPNLGGPEQIAIGNGLSLVNGVLSGATQYSPSNFPVASSLGLDSIVPVAQNGQDRSVTVRTLLSTGNADISGQLARGGVGISRRLGDWVSDAIAIEAFGAVGDGVSDDSGPFGLAVASGRPVLLGAKTYRIDGQLNVQSATVLLGTPGLSVLRRSTQQGGAWINVAGPRFVGVGVTFDAGGVAGDSWGVLLTPTCLHSVFRDCTFLNATGQTLGSGLTIQARDGLAGHLSSHSISNCVFQNNACHGLWIQAACGADVTSCRAFGNGAYGINLDFNDPLFQQTVRQSVVSNCKCWSNARGISIGNYNAVNAEPPRWGLENPDATDIVVSENICSGNSAYGIAVSGSRIQVTNNIIVIEGASDTASGILCNAGLTTLAFNVIAGPGQFGIDAGGSLDLSIVSNTVANCAVGINAGGSARVCLGTNELSGNQRAITLFQVETDGRGGNFGISCSDIRIEANHIQLNPGSGGIFLIDGPERIEILRNQFVASAPVIPDNLFWSYTDSATIYGNTFNGSAEIIVAGTATGGLSQLAVPELFDTIVLDASSSNVDAIIGQHQANMVGQISFVRVTSGGTGYSWANVAVTGEGSGATATAYIRDGVVIGIAMTSNGSGYVAATTTVTIVGDGHAATAQPAVGVPYARSRRLRMRCLGAVQFSQQAGLTNWTNAAITIPARAEIVWQSASTGWQAASFDNLDYVSPGGDGSLSIKSVAGDIRLRPAPGGSVRFVSSTDPIGFLTSFGRGSPEGVVAAPPGSDYRNLNGGAGLTLWLKQTGSGSSGWVAVA